MRVPFQKKMKTVFPSSYSSSFMVRSYDRSNLIWTFWIAEPTVFWFFKPKIEESWNYYPRFSGSDAKRNISFSILYIIQSIPSHDKHWSWSGSFNKNLLKNTLKKRKTMQTFFYSGKELKQVWQRIILSLKRTMKQQIKKFKYYKWKMKNLLNKSKRIRSRFKNSWWQKWEQLWKRSLLRIHLDMMKYVHPNVKWLTKLY